MDGDVPRRYRVHTLAGLIQPELLPDGQVCVDMGPPTLCPQAVPTTLEASQDGAAVAVPLQIEGTSWPMTCVSMGNPHAVTFGPADSPIQVASLPLAQLGPHFETHPAFPAKTNTEFVEVLDRGHVRMVVWERGAGITLACGTGACATLVAGVLEGRLNNVCQVDLPGGPLQIEWQDKGNRHVYMTGPAELVFAGQVALK
ncbi:hypothetical protein WJX84_008182 [Apatococcus fuscideae]